jgi:hypothetical protein
MCMRCHNLHKGWLASPTSLHTNARLLKVQCTAHDPRTRHTKALAARPLSSSADACACHAGASFSTCASRARARAPVPALCISLRAVLPADSIWLTGGNARGLGLSQAGAPPEPSSAATRTSSSHTASASKAARARMARQAALRTAGASVLPRKAAAASAASATMPRSAGAARSLLAMLRSASTQVDTLAWQRPDCRSGAAARRQGCLA